MAVAKMRCPRCGVEVACKVPVVQLVRRGAMPAVPWTVLNCPRQQCQHDIPVYLRDFGVAEAA